METLSISKEQVLILTHCIEDMSEIFRERQLMFNEADRVRFFGARNKIYGILTVGLKEVDKDKAMRAYWKKAKT
jgi:hypothetical protein